MADFMLLLYTTDPRLVLGVGLAVGVSLAQFLPRGQARSAGRGIAPAQTALPEEEIRFACGCTVHGGCGCKRVHPADRFSHVPTGDHWR